MFSATAASALAAATAPLVSSFGADLTLWRDGDVVHWAYEGRSVVVAFEFDGTAGATFVDAAETEYVSGTTAQAVYRRRNERPYRLTPDGAAALVADIMAFFSGDREPLFTFVEARTLDV